MHIHRHLDELDSQGFTVIADFLPDADVARVRAQFRASISAATGRNNFEGLLTERVYTLVGRPGVRGRADDARVLALFDRPLAPGFLLTASQAIGIRPGESPQPFHFDDSFYTIPRPRPSMVSHHRCCRRLHARERWNRGDPRQSPLGRRKIAG